MCLKSSLFSFFWAAECCVCMWLCFGAACAVPWPFFQQEIQPLSHCTTIAPHADEPQNPVFNSEAASKRVTIEEKPAWNDLKSWVKPKDEKKKKKSSFRGAIVLLCMNL